LVIFALDLNLPKGVALIALSVLGGFSALGRLTMGVISDRIGRKRTLVINLCLQIFCWLWIMVTNQSWMILLFAAAFGLSYGGLTQFSRRSSAIISAGFGQPPSSGLFLPSPDQPQPSVHWSAVTFTT
jgi:MFS family permease